ncbi:MAG: hypothetical protein ACRD2C_01740 [Acidimicrobiales bacterium]
MPRTRPLPTSRSSSPVSGPLPLAQLVADVSSALDGHEPGTLLRVTGNPVELGFRHLGAEHPLDVLIGFTAPRDWLALGVHCSGRAFSLDHAPPEPQAVIITTLVDRSGRGAGLLRYLPSGGRSATRGPDDSDRATARAGNGDDDGDGEVVTRYDDAPEGLIGDACRRALGVPTAPPPASTAELWLRLWLDRVVEAAVFSGRDDCKLGWNDVVALHPAATLGSGGRGGAMAGPAALDDPYAVAEMTLALAERWDWARLRRDPEVLAFAGPPVTPDLAAWMDDGMFARVVLADLAALPVVARTTRLLLPQSLLDDIDDVIMATGLQSCPSSEAVAQ